MSFHRGSDKGSPEARIFPVIVQEARSAAVLKKMLAVALFSAPLVLPADPLPAADRTVIVSVPGIPGPYCAYGVEKRLYELDGVRQVVPVWEKEQIRVVIKDGKTVTSEQIRAAFENSEYPYDYQILAR